jgi:hypothetical protein
MRHPPLLGQYLKDIPIQRVEKKHSPGDRGVDLHEGHYSHARESIQQPLQQCPVCLNHEAKL